LLRGSLLKKENLGKFVVGGSFVIQGILTTIESLMNIERDEYLEKMRWSKYKTLNYETEF